VGLGRGTWWDLVGLDSHFHLNLIRLKVTGEFEVFLLNRFMFKTLELMAGGHLRRCHCLVPPLGIFFDFAVEIFQNARPKGSNNKAETSGNYDSARPIFVLALSPSPRCV
jgi:hypothetical protein